MWVAIAGAMSDLHRGAKSRPQRWPGLSVAIVLHARAPATDTAAVAHCQDADGAHSVSAENDGSVVAGHASKSQPRWTSEKGASFYALRLRHPSRAVAPCRLSISFTTSLSPTSASFCCRATAKIVEFWYPSRTLIPSRATPKPAHFLI